MEKCPLKDLDWRRLPNLDNREGAVERHAGCPKGGKDHVAIWPHGDRRDPRPRMWCRWCNQMALLDDQSGVIIAPLPTSREPTIDQSLADKYHRSITEQAYGYFQGRGISREVADARKLGWRETWADSDGCLRPFKRYSIPCYYPYKGQSKLHGIQYRASGPTKLRYISEPGSINSVLFNTQILPLLSGLYIIVVESPLDALALLSYGYPAVAPFDGNAKGSWKQEWTKLLANIPERIIIPDNDEGAGELLAKDKLERIPHSRLLYLPKEFKDTGKLIENNRENAGDILESLLHLPRVLQNYGST